MKKANLFVSVLLALCAVVWSVRAVLDVIYRVYDTSVFLFLLDILCAIVWIVALVVNLRRYSAQGKKQA